MRIEQPAQMTPLYVESFRRDTQLGVRHFLLVGVLPSVLTLGWLAFDASNGRPIVPLLWLLGAGMGPIFIVVLKLRLRFEAAGNRFAEVRGNRVRLGPQGYSFRPALLIACWIEPDIHFSDVYRLLFCFRLTSFDRPRYWSMMVANFDEAEEFRREIVSRPT